MMIAPFKFAAVGLDHRHIYGMAEGMPPLITAGVAGHAWMSAPPMQLLHRTNWTPVDAFLT